MRGYQYLESPTPIAFAHRGGAKERVENTLAAFAHSYDLGYRYMETDARLTADGVVVAFHDPDLARMAGLPSRVRDLTWKALSSIPLETGERLSRLDDLLGAWTDVRWNIDPKEDAAVAPLAETLARCGVIDRVCVTSFSDRRVKQVKAALGPSLCTALGPRAVGALRLASLSPAPLPPASLSCFSRYGAVQVPISFRRIRIVDRRFVATAHRAGLQVHVWTIDERDQMEALLDLGVDGIMTDRPTVLKDLLAKRTATSRPEVREV